MGYVRMAESASLPEDHRLVEKMYVVPELAGKGYCEQLFGYAATVLRYENIFHAVMPRACSEEELRVMGRFTFEDMPEQAEFRVLHLACRPCPYPVLA